MKEIKFISNYCCLVNLNLLFVVELAMAELCAASLINPGPDDQSLLYLHRKHVSQAVWQGDVSQFLFNHMQVT